MKNQKGITLIEMLIVVSILASFVIVIAIASGVNPKTGVSIGWNGRVETRCISGYKFVVGGNGTPAQVLDNTGKGVMCNE